MPVKTFENRSIFGEDMDKSFRLTFWATCMSDVLKLYVLFAPRIVSSSYSV